MDTSTLTVATDHRCAFCTPETRALYARASATANAVEAALNAPGHWSPAVWQMKKLRETLRELQPVLADHIEAS